MPGHSNFNLIAHADNAGGATTTIATPKFDLYNFLRIYVRITGYSAGQVAQLRFNGDTGTTAYAYAVQEFTGAATPVATGASAVAATAAGIKVAVTAITGARALIVFDISNINGQVHGITFNGSSGSLAAATAPVSVLGSGVWATTSQITQVTLDSGGAGTLNVGSSVDIFGLLG